MNICYINFTKIPSAQADSIHVMKVCQEMARQGHTVNLIVPDIKSGFGENLKPIWHHYGIQHPFNIQTLPAPIKAISYYALPRPLTAHFFAWQAIRYARCLNPDLVYTRHLPTAVLAARIGMTTVYEIHEIYVGFTGKLMGSYLYLLYRGKGFRHFVILTKALKADLIHKFPSIFKNAKMIVAPDGVDLERFEDLPQPQIARKKLGLKLGTNLVAGYAGNFYPGKGVERIYELARRCSQIKFLIMGGEPDAVTLYKEQLERDGLRNLILTGFIPNGELPMYLAACDVLLLPNHYADVKTQFRENFVSWTSPMKLFEYMAVGRTIIASDLPVLREVLHDENALLCPPDDLDSWQQALRQCADNEVKLEALSARARQEVAKFAWSNRVAQCLDELACDHSKQEMS